MRRPEHVAEILQGRDQIAHGFDDVGLEVAAADDAFLGQEIDQNEQANR